MSETPDLEVVQHGTREKKTTRSRSPNGAFLRRTSTFDVVRDNSYGMVEAFFPEVLPFQEALPPGSLTIRP